VGKATTISRVARKRLAWVARAFNAGPASLSRLDREALARELHGQARQLRFELPPLRA